MLRADRLHSSLDAHCGLPFRVLAGARPLGGVVVGQLPHPVGKANLDVSIEGGNWESLEGKTMRNCNVVTNWWEVCNTRQQIYRM